jgi:hypothetical protein
MNWQIHWSVAKIKREKVPETLEQNVEVITQTVPPQWALAR